MASGPTAKMNLRNRAISSEASPLTHTRARAQARTHTQDNAKYSDQNLGPGITMSLKVKQYLS